MSNVSSCSLDDVKRVVHKWLYLEDDSMVDVMCAGYVANLFQSDPTWIVFIGPPSNAKTELLRMLDGHPGVYFLSNMTPSTLISGKNENHNSLLFQLTNKTLVLKDFGTILVMRSESQQEILSQLREIYDGQYSKGFGNREAVHWNGHMGLLAAATPVFDRHYGVNNALGDRFLIYRAKNSNEDAIGKKAQELVGQEEEMRKDLREAVHPFLGQFNAAHMKEARVTLDDDFKKMLRLLVSFCARARCHVFRNPYTREIEQAPEPEGPARLIKQLTQMAVALALIRGSQEVDSNVSNLIRRLGRDIVPPLRLRVVEKLYNERITSNTWFTTRDIGESTNVPTNTAKLVLEDLMVVGLVNRKREKESDTAPYEWQLTDACQEWFAVAELPSDTPF